MAVAIAVSAAMAVLATGLSIVGLMRSVSASKDAQAAREKASTAQWKMSEHLEAIAEAQAQAARIAAQGGAPPTRDHGRLSARLVRQGRGERLVVANVGTMAVTVDGVEVQPNVLLGDQVDEIVGAELDPGEDLTLLAALTMGTRLPLSVTMRWRDSQGATHERVQTVTLS